MATLHATGMDVRTLADGVEYTLPKRDLGVLKAIGVVIVVASLSSVLPFWLPLLTGRGRGWGVFDFIFATVPMLAGLGGAMFGLGILTGRSRVRVTRDQIQAVEQIGLFRWTRSRGRASLTGLNVMSLAHQSQSSSPSPLPGLGMIRADFQSHRPLMVAIGYPMPLLRRLADELADQLQQSGVSRISGRDDPKHIKVTEQSAWDTGEPEQDQVMQQPDNSKVHYETIEGGTSLHVPAAGWRKGAGTMLFIAIFWLGITGVITGAMINDRSVPWFAYLLMAMFWAVGIGLVLGAIHLSRQRAIIDMIGDTLLITRTGWLFGTKQHEWPAQQIRSVRMGSSGTQVNNRTLMQLQINDADGKTLGLFTGRDEPELKWMAWVIQRDLGLIAPQQEEADD